MTTVHISLGRDDGTTKTAAKGVVEWEPTTRREDGTMVILERGFTVPLVAGEATVTVDPSGLTWCWRVTERTDSGGTVRYVAVPDSAAVVEYVDLPDVDPTTLVAWSPADPEASYLAALAALELDDLADVDTTGATDGQALVYDAATETWGPGTAGAVTSVDGKTGAVSLSSTYEPLRGADDYYVTGAEKAALHTHPAVIAQGATAADARAAIGAGTSSLVIGTTAGTAKAGDYEPDLSGLVTLGTAQSITGIKTLTAPVMVAANPEPVFGPDLAPAMDAWTLAGGASWAAPDLTIPAGGTISTTITVEAGAIYHIELTTTATGGSGVQVQLGSVVALMSSHYTTPIPIQSSGSGTQTLTIGGGTWTATLQDVAVRKVTPAGPAAVIGASDLRSAGSYNNALGSAAQLSLTTGSYNNALGSAAQLSLTTGSYNNALGYAAQYSLTTGSANNAVGTDVQSSLTTGSNNNAVGYQAQYSLTTGRANNAVGTYVQSSLTKGSYNNAVGYQAQYSLTTGAANNAVGYAAQQSPRGNPAWATTTASRQTSIGHESGQGSSTQSDDIVTVGYRALADGAGAVSLGSGATAAHAGSVALGMSTVTTATAQVAVGARDVEVQDATRGVILKSPDGTRYRVTVANGGTLSVAAA